MEMTVTMTEIALFVWAMVATAAWLRKKEQMRFYKNMTAEVLLRLAQGRLRIVETQDGFELKEAVRVGE